MYIPSQFQQPDKSSLISAIQSIKFGSLIIYFENEYFSAHIPFLIKEQSHQLYLECHVSRANKIWEKALATNKVLVIFQGPDAYISPTWYPTKAKTGKVVPTWNYQAIHCHGYAESQHEEEWKLKHIEELTENNELSHGYTWRVTDAPQDYIASLIKGIVGIKIQIDNLEGALKMNQHHVKENRLGAIDGLLKSSKPNDFEVAKIMRELEKNRT